MRVWTVMNGETFEGYDTRWLCVDGAPVADLNADLIEPDFAAFIVDACNAAEQRLQTSKVEDWLIATHGQAERDAASIEGVMSPADVTQDVSARVSDDDEGRWVWHRHQPQWEAHQHYGRHLAEEKADPGYAEVGRRYGIYKGGKMVREVAVAAGEAVRLVDGESLGPLRSESGEQFIIGKPDECPTCGPKPHTHVVGITGRQCAEDYCSGYWDNMAWHEKHKAHVDSE